MRDTGGQESWKPCLVPGAHRLQGRDQDVFRRQEVPVRSAGVCDGLVELEVRGALLGPSMFLISGLYCG